MKKRATGPSDPFQLHNRELTVPSWLEALYDSVPDTVFFIKDSEGRYTTANQTLADRLKLNSKRELIGKTAAEVFAGALGEHYSAQDKDVLTTGQGLSGVMELHIYPGGHEGWCLTWKLPIIIREQGIVGLAGISRDLPAWSVVKPENRKLARALDQIHNKLEEPLRIFALASEAGLSVYQLDARIKQLFGVPAAQFITRTRIGRACQMLMGAKTPISAIALACGYSDQAAFTRQFRQSTGLTPLQYRQLRRC